MAKQCLGIGIDGCRGGWLLVGFDGHAATMHLLPQIEEVGSLDLPAQIPIWIDMPIGLVDAGPEGRTCDQLARKKLSPIRHSSVFTPPCRAAAYAEKLAASAINFKHTGKKLSQQSLNIIPKIRELDAYLQSLEEALAKRWFEAHPELVFAALNAGQPLAHKKKTVEGEQQRINLLKPWFAGVHDWLKEARQVYLRKRVLPDDIVDALGIAVASFLVQTRQAERTTLPANPPLDGVGLPQRIVYAQPLK